MEQNKVQKQTHRNTVGRSFTKGQMLYSGGFLTNVAETTGYLQAKKKKSRQILHKKLTQNGSQM